MRGLRLFCVWWLVLWLVVNPATAASYYVTSSGAGDLSGSSTGNAMAWSRLSDYMSTGGSYTAAAGDVFNIHGEVYTLDAIEIWVNAGSATAPITIQACDSSWNVVVPTRTNWGLLNTNTTAGTACPYINCATYSLNATGAASVNFTGLRIHTNRNGYAIGLGTNAAIYGCAVTNEYNNSSASAITLGGSYSTVTDCDAACTGASLTAAPIVVSTGCRVYGCVVYGSKSYGINVNASSAVVQKCLIYGCSDYGIYKSTTVAASYWTVTDNTVYGKGISIGNAAYTNLDVVIGNHLTSGSGWAFYAPNLTGSAVLLAFNRTRDNSSGAIGLAGTWGDSTTWQHITAAAGSPSSNDMADFVDPVSRDLRLQPTAAAVEKGLFGSIGAMQLPAATIPSAPNVRSGSGNYGYGFDAQTPTLTLPTASQVLATVSFGGGGTEYTGNVVLPSVQDVQNGVTFGSLSALTGLFAWPAITDVKSGVSYGYSGEYTGTYAGGGSTVFIPVEQ